MVSLLILAHLVLVASLEIINKHLKVAVMCMALVLYMLFPNALD
jgi:hypothetical protein